METKIITLANFQEINKSLEALWEKAKNDNGTRCEHLAIFGRDAIAEYLRVYDPEGKINYTVSNLKTDGKTRAELVPYIYIELNCNYWDKIKHVIKQRIYYARDLVLFDGQIYSIYTGNKSTAEVTIFGDDWNYYKNYLPANWEKENPEPQKIGTITDKKMTVWAEYLKQKRAAADQVFNEKQNAAAVLRAKLAALDGSKFDYIKINDNSGQIIKNGLEYHFNITDTNTVREYIEVHYKAPQTIAAFLDMIAGNYKKESNLI